MSGVEIQLSGGVEVWRAEEPVTLPGRRVRALLVLLATSAGRTLSADTLVRGIWDNEPPENARASLQTYVGRLRRALGNELVVTGANGYSLAVPRSDIDLLRFEDLVDGTGAGGPADERQALHSALALWRGEPFGDAPSAWIERQLVSLWVERYLQAFERRVDLDLAAGEHAAYLPQLRDLVDRHPLRETLWARLLTSLQKGGRTAEALERYEVLRTRLAEELGVDPSPELREIHQRLLTAEAPASYVPKPSPAVPQQLPSALGRFTGRRPQLEALDAALRTGEQVLAIHGPGGVGKTALAVHWARRIAEKFPDGQLFVDLRGYGPGEASGSLDALDSLLRGLGVPGGQIPADEDDRAALLRSELAEKRVLMLLDNARATGQVRPLLPGGDSVAIVTSRSQLRGLVAREGALRVPVDPMPPDDAVALLRGRLGGADDDTYDAALAELAELCGHLPVALSVAAERASRDGAPRLELVTERLRSERGRVAALSDWEDDPLTGVRAVFAWSYDVLDPDTARMFRLLGLLPDSQVALDAAAALAGTDVSATERTLDRLTDRHLLREVRSGWYEVHDLTHAYAGELATQAGSEAEREAAVQRLRNWYVCSARNADYALVGRPIVDHVVVAAAPQTSPVELRTEADAARWFSEHIRTIRSVLTDATTDGDHTTVATLTPSLAAYHRTTGALREWVMLCETAQESARAIDQPITEGLVANQLGNTYDNLGYPDAALALYRQARGIFESIDNEHGTMLVDINLGTHFGSRGQPDVEMTHYESALRSARNTGRLDQLASLQNNLASCYLDLGRHQEALDAAVASVGVDREARPPVERAAHLLTLAEAQGAVAKWVDAEETLGQAVDLCGRLGFTAYEAYALHLLGSAQRALGRLADARASWTDALSLLETISVSEHIGIAADDVRSRIAELPPEA